MKYGKVNVRVIALLQLLYNDTGHVHCGEGMRSTECLLVQQKKS